MLLVQEQWSAAAGQIAIAQAQLHKLAGIQVELEAENERLRRQTQAQQATLHSVYHSDGQQVCLYVLAVA